MIFIHIKDSGILVLSNIRDFYRLADPVFFSRSASEREMWIFSMVAITTIGITNYFYCIIIVSQSSSLFIV